jgi:MFS family permease
LRPGERRVAGPLAYAGFAGLATLDASGYGVIAPVIPEIADATGSGPVVTGALVATFGVGMAAGFVLAGAGIQRRDAAFVLAGSVVLMGLGAIGFATIESLPLYFASRFAMGLGSGGLWMGIALGVIERWPGDELRRLSGIMASYSVGGIAGPALGAIGGIRAPFLAYLGVVALAGAALRLLGPPHEHAEGFVSDRRALRAPGFLLSAAGVLMVAITIGTFDGVLPLHFSERLGQGEIGGLYAGTSLVLAFWAYASSRLPARPTLVAATALIVGGLALAGAGDVVWVWVVALLVVAAGFGLAETASIGILLDAVGTQRIILAMVVWSQIFALGYLVGPVAGGVVAETLGFGAIGLVPLAFATLVVAGLVRARRAAAMERA